MIAASVQPQCPAEAERFQRNFRFGSPYADLKIRSIRGGAVMLVAQGCRFAIQLISTMILARLLTPTDFGLVTMVIAITSFVSMFKDLGLSQATIQHPHITHAQVSTLFWVNLVLSAALMLLVAALAPAISWFYAEPRLQGITLVLAATFIVSGSAVQHQALLRRQMRLGAIAAIETVSYCLGTVTAVVLAYWGASYWSLVAVTPVATAVSTLLVWLFCTWRPGAPSRGTGLRAMLAFGGNISIYNAVSCLARSADRIFIGWACGASPVGLYSKAQQLLLLPLSQVSTPLHNVVVPALSRLQDHPLHFQRYFTAALNGILWITAPCVALLAACSDELIRIVLGPQWTEASVLFRILAASALVQPLHYMVPWVLVSLGRTDRLLRWGIGSSLMMVIAFLAGLPFGPQGVAVGYFLAFTVLGLPWTIFYGLAGLQLNRRVIFRSMASPLLCSSVMFLVAASACAATSGLGLCTRLVVASSAAALAVALLVAVVRPVRQELKTLIDGIVSLLFASNFKHGHGSLAISSPAC